MTTNTDRLIAERLDAMATEQAASEDSLKRELREVISIAERTLTEVEGGFNITTDPAFIARHAAEAAAFAAERQNLAREHRILRSLVERAAKADALDSLERDIDSGEITSIRAFIGDEEVSVDDAFRAVAEEAAAMIQNRKDRVAADAKARRAAQRRNR